MTEVTLVTVLAGKDSGGLPVYSEERTEAYAEEKSTVRSEFYGALRAGIEVKVAFEMRQEDFEMSAREAGGVKAYASKLEHEGAVYSIKRAYKKGKARIELVCG